MFQFSNFHQGPLLYRSSNQGCSMKKALQIYFKKGLKHRCFAVNFAKFLRTPFLQNTSGRLLLIILKTIRIKESIRRKLIKVSSQRGFSQISQYDGTQNRSVEFRSVYRNVYSSIKKTKWESNLKKNADIEKLTTRKFTLKKYLL